MRYFLWPIYTDIFIALYSAMYYANYAASMNILKTKICRENCIGKIKKKVYKLCANVCRKR